MDWVLEEHLQTRLLPFFYLMYHQALSTSSLFPLCLNSSSHHLFLGWLHQLLNWLTRIQASYSSIHLHSSDPCKLGLGLNLYSSVDVQVAARSVFYLSLLAHLWLRAHCTTSSVTKHSLCTPPIHHPAPVVLKVWSQASSIKIKPLEQWNLGLYLKPILPGTLGMRLRNLCLNKLSWCFWDTFKFEIHCHAS